MAASDLFKRSLEAGTALVDKTRERVEEVVERGRRATDELQEMVRREVAEQLGALGVATRDDVARLEAKIEAATAAATAATAASRPRSGSAKKGAPRAKAPPGPAT